MAASACASALLGLLGLLGLAAAKKGTLNNYPVVCWGGNDHGQLGIDSDVSSSLPIYTNADDIEGNIVQIASGNHFMVLLDSMGYVYTWGKNDYCQLGYESRSSDPTFEGAQYVSKPRKVNLSRKITHIAAGAEHAFAFINGTEAYAWGANTYGEANPTKIEGNEKICVPQLVDFSTYLNGKDASRTIKKLAGGETSSYILTESGNVFSWGDNTRGQLGLGNFDQQILEPTLVKFPTIGQHVCSFVTDLVAGTNFVLATCDSNSKLFGWGDNTYFLVSDDEAVHRTCSPNFLGPITGTDKWTNTLTSLSGLDNHAVFLSGGQFYCWGSNSKSECGAAVENNNNNEYRRPTSTIGIHTMGSLLSAGNSFTIMMDRYGTFRATGDNQNYQLGTAKVKLGAMSNGFVPVQFDSLSPKPSKDPYMMVSGSFHTCVLYGKYEAPEKKPISFGDVYVWILLADVIISGIYFIVIGIMECLKR